MFCKLFATLHFRICRIIPLPFRDCTRSTHPPFYRRRACRDFDSPYLSPIDPLASHESVSDTTNTTQSDCSDHVCRLHPTVSCDESLPPEPEPHTHSTSHRTDAQKHTYHVSSSMHDHNAVLFTYLY